MDMQDKRRNRFDFLKIAEMAEGISGLPPKRNLSILATEISRTHAWFYTRYDLEVGYTTRVDREAERFWNSIRRLHSSLTNTALQNRIDTCCPGASELIERLYRCARCATSESKLRLAKRSSKKGPGTEGSLFERVVRDRLVGIFFKQFGVKATARNGESSNTSFNRFAAVILRGLGVLTVKGEPYRLESIASALSHARRGRRRKGCGAARAKKDQNAQLQKCGRVR